MIQTKTGGAFVQTSAADFRQVMKLIEIEKSDPLFSKQNGKSWIPGSLRVIDIMAGNLHASEAIMKPGDSCYCCQFALFSYNNEKRQDKNWLNDVIRQTWTIIDHPPSRLNG